MVGRMFLYLLSFGFAISRFFVPVHGLSREDVYKDMAHVFIGILLGVYVRGRKDLEGHSDYCGWLATGLIVVEVVAAIIRR